MFSVRAQMSERVRFPTAKPDKHSTDPYLIKTAFGNTNIIVFIRLYFNEEMMEKTPKDGELIG